MRAQASLEYLMLSAVALALLSASVVALGSIKESSDRGLSAFSFRSSALALSNAINELCALGDGNGRELRLTSGVSVQSEKADEGWVVRFSDAGTGLSLARKSRCEAADAELPEGTVYAENTGGAIKFAVR